MKDVAFGQYYPVSSVVHRLDPRIKIVLLICYIVAVFIVKSFWGFALLGLFLLLSIFLAHVPLFSVIRSVKAIIFIIAITFIINVLFHRDETEKVLWAWWKIKITDKALEFAVFMALRLTFLVLGSCILTLTTAPVELTDGIESLLKPLKFIKFPVHELALVMSIALRFIPSLMEETSRIISAQKARGAEFESGSLLKRAKALVPVLIPLLIASFRRAEELGDAMDARCYSESKVRTKYKKLKLHLRDFFATLTMVALIAGVVCLNIYTVAVV